MTRSLRSVAVRTGGPVPFGAVLATLALPALATDRFCQDGLTGLSGTDVGGVPLVLVDPGLASATRLGESGFVTYEVVRGTDADGLEERLRHDTAALASLQTECMERVPSCAMIFFAADPATGFTRRVTHSGLDQFEYRLLLGGEQVRVRVTANDPMSDDTLQAVKQLMAEVLRHLLPPCRE